MFEIAEYISQVDKWLKNPFVKDFVVNNRNPVWELLEAIPGEYQSFIIDHLKANHKEVYDSLYQAKDTIDFKNDPGSNKEILDYILGLKGEGYSYREIADFLDEDFKIVLDPKQIWRIIQKFSQEGPKIEHTKEQDQENLKKDNALNLDALADSVAKKLKPQLIAQSAPTQHRGLIRKLIYYIY